MSVIRAFIALDISPEIQKRIDEVTQQYQEKLSGVPIRWVPGEKIHLTIKFLGDVSVANLDLLTDIIKVETSHQESFEISVGGSGAYPRINKPRVLWVGVEAPANLQVLQRGIANEVEKLGYAREKRVFSPHLTIGRVGRNVTRNGLKKLIEMIESNKIGFLGVSRIKDVCLYRSELKTSGAEYTRLFSAPLQQKNNQ